MKVVTGHVQLTLEQWRGLGVLHSRKLRAVIDSLETTTVGPSHWQIQPTADGKLSSICGWETKVGNAKILYSICRRFNLQMWNLLMQSRRIQRADFDFIYWKKKKSVCKWICTIQSQGSTVFTSKSYSCTCNIQHWAKFVLLWTNPTLCILKANPHYLR